MALNLDQLTPTDGSTRKDMRVLTDAERKFGAMLEARFSAKPNSYVAEFDLPDAGDREELRDIITAYVAGRDSLSVTFPTLVPDKWGTVLHLSSKQAAEEVREMLGKGYRTGERKPNKDAGEPGGPVITRSWLTESVAKTEVGKLRAKLATDPRVKSIADVTFLEGHGKAHWNVGTNVTVRIAGAK